MSSVPVKYIETDPATGQVIATIPLDLSGGIVGFMADENDCVSFHLGWAVNITEDDKNLERINNAGGWVHLRVSKVPEALRAIKHFDMLELTFTNKVEIPDWLYRMDIDHLIIRGDISKNDRKKMENRFRGRVDFKK